MTVKEIKEIVSHILHVDPNAVVVGRDRTHIYCRSVSATYDELLKLSQELGTTNINFVYQEGEPGYSSWTPSTDGSFELTIGIGAAS